ncbi:hypothetical protein [Elizabethkingia meningoseptica]|uniref:hypothetical protein n=1 Tax=Elizabethkingia meningoseptica TaxID=238 RepID=UPI001628DF0C|nr:hypothetical protein [Elizabethkingia meningoseptica]MCT4085504.1 hypothetical protein [Elizabethkingia anophelis]MBG0514045.1 hypothetical protein [Elizabethkingia meningoseptica]MCT4156940.1 hypothetical protein [Elizabethkingia anophelis]MCT4171261.1 hypothetical protein [Elizabethkingia anophelis]MCT4245676.1 hypothetical protein [Elizabethkingia anophelis]
MKRTILFICIIYCILIPSQNKILKGVGIFQINKTNISVIDSLKNNGFKEEYCRSNYKCVRNTANDKYILLPLEDQIERPLINDHKVVWISHYTIADIDISDMKLEFYKDILYSIEINGVAELEEALQTKYFNVHSKKYNTVSCTSMFGIIKKEGWMFTTNFTKDPKIKSIAKNEKYYNDDCEERYLSYMLIYDLSTDANVRSKENIQRQIIEKNENEKLKLELKNKYKDL